MADSTHVTDEDLANLHDQGKCLTRHQKRSEGHQCSHQWQAQVRAETEDFDVYKHDKYHSLCGKGRWETAVLPGSTFPWGYGQTRAAPSHAKKNWDPGKSGNFTHFIKPYWHNAHHIIPNRALSTAIGKAGAQDARIPNLIKSGLLKAGYNLNDMVNMIILPMERRIAATLGLPRHLKRDEGGPGKPEFRSHSDYSARVEGRLESIVDGYKKTVARGLKKKHPKPPNALSKKKLLDESQDVHDEIVSQGPSMEGAALDELDL